jgi:hypothetical protein
MTEEIHQSPVEKRLAELERQAEEQARKEYRERNAKLLARHAEDRLRAEAAQAESDREVREFEEIKRRFHEQQHQR